MPAIEKIHVASLANPGRTKAGGGTRHDRRERCALSVTTCQSPFAIFSSTPVSGV